MGHWNRLPEESLSFGDLQGLVRQIFLRIILTELGAEGKNEVTTVSPTSSDYFIGGPQAGKLCS